MSWRILIPILIASLANLTTIAQCYQALLFESKPDRNKCLATMHGGVEVEAFMCVANLSNPLVPCMGARSITYRPMLSIHVVPIVDDRRSTIVSGAGASSSFGKPRTSREDSRPEAFAVVT